MINGVTTYYPNQYYEKQVGGAADKIIKYYYTGSSRIAERENGTLTWIITDHLGSTTALANEDGTLKTLMRYTAYGEIRSANGSGEVTDYRYTGQRSEGEVGLYWYTSRMYDPALGRFIQPDSIIPDPGSSKGYDRYAYVNNNPVNFNDPSGHASCGDQDEYGHCVNDDWKPPSQSSQPDSSPVESQSTGYPLNLPGGIDCTGTLSECFGDTVRLKDFKNYSNSNPISIEEFEDFADEVASDLNTHDLGAWPGLEADRQAYDTPFYNGGESERRTGIPNAEQGVYPSSQLVCIDTIGCYARSEINYLAQGMWGAATGEPYFVSELITRLWKAEEYRGQKPSAGTLFWLRWGYDYYQEKYK